jgi:hypothetical protein
MNLADLQDHCQRIGRDLTADWHDHLNRVPQVVALADADDPFVAGMPMPLRITIENCFTVGTMMKSAYPKAQALFILTEEFVTLGDFLTGGSEKHRQYIVFEGQTLEHKGCYAIYDLTSEQAHVVGSYQSPETPSPHSDCVTALIDGYLSAD